MEELNKKSSRKNFFIWGAGILSSFTALRILSSSKKKESKSETVKMLTQDGRLVEIDKKMLAAGGKKITNTELQEWVKK